jgi:hypothetical protein
VGTQHTKGKLAPYKWGPLLPTLAMGSHRDEVPGLNLPIPKQGIVGDQELPHFLTICLVLGEKRGHEKETKRRREKAEKRRRGEEGKKIRE